jgi:hypothetical protein
MTRQVARLSVLLLATTAFGCGGNKSQTAAGTMACDPVEGNLPANVDVASWAGAYRLTLVATSGDSSGNQTSGVLRLGPQLDELQSPEAGSMDAATSMPLIGTVDLDLAAVHAVQVGSLDSEDPLAPGVLVLERHYEKQDGDPAAEVTIRFGSDANRRGITRFDGGYAALFALQAGTSGIAGNWASGVTSLQSGGHFCAVPVDG